MTTHPIDTEALRRLADAATAGPWENARNGVQQSLDAATKAGDYRYEGVGIVPEEYVRQDDAEFIAAARTAVPALLDALAAAEHRATRAEAQSAIRGRAVVIYRDRAREAEAERDWNLRSSRLAKEGRIKANARAESAEARIRDLTQEVRDERGAALDALEQVKVRDARIRAVERLALAADDGTEYEHNGHPAHEGEAECPGCWALGIRNALGGDA